MGSKQDVIFYMISGTIIGWLASKMGASMSVDIFASLLIPPVLILLYRLRG